MESKKPHSHATALGMLITLGIIFGDIGTSPLYVMKEIIAGKVISEELIFGGLSCVFWTLTLQTTFKYVVLTLKADNNGEGGIFSLFALVRKRGKYLLWPAIIGGCTLLADGVITPPISVASAIEGLRIIEPGIDTVPIVIAILIVLFIIQGFGTKHIGNAFGPIMLIWFLMLGVLGSIQIMTNPGVLKALNPYYAYNLLVNYPMGFWLLGAVFLCTTGAEALYSDLGHCGRENIRISWAFVKMTLLLNYFGQGAWILKYAGQILQEQNPFYAIMPNWFLLCGIIISTLATIIASQALITGSFTLISEAIRLNLWPKVKVSFPTMQRGQIYIASINWLLLLGCIGIVLHFRESSNMGAAYGLAISLTMLMTTILLAYYLYKVKHKSLFLVLGLLLLYLTIETSFLIANLSKFMHGGYVTLIIGGVLFLIMYVWHRAIKIKDRLTEFVPIADYLPMIKELSADNSIPKYATHLVYMTGANNPTEIESKIVYSIFQKQPKRADIYWFIHIEVVDEPYLAEYKVNIMLSDDAVRVDFKLGFRIEQKVNLFFRKVVEDLVHSKEVDFVSRYNSLSKRNVIGDFRFVVLEKHLSNDNNLSRFDQLTMDAYFLLKKGGLSESAAFGLDTSAVTVEKVPLVIIPAKNTILKRVW